MQILQKPIWRQDPPVDPSLVVYIQTLKPAVQEVASSPNLAWQSRVQEPRLQDSSILTWQWACRTSKGSENIFLFIFKVDWSNLTSAIHMVLKHVYDIQSSVSVHFCQGTRSESSLSNLMSICRCWHCAARDLSLPCTGIHLERPIQHKAMPSRILELMLRKGG